MNARLIGAVFAMLTLLAAGLSTGTRVYYLLFFVLLAMLLLGLVSAVWTVFTVKIDMKGVRARANRGDTLMTVFTVKHASLLPVASVRICVNVPSYYSPMQEISVSTPPFAERSFRHMIQCPHRGVYEAGVTKISARDMFGFFCVSRKPGMKLIRMEVLPQIRHAAEMKLRSVDMGPEFMARASEDAASPSDVRAWQDGDSLKKVHWKLSMRRREIMVRTYEESARPDTLIIPDLSEITAMKDHRLTVEDCICESCLAVAKAQLEAGYPVQMPLTSLKPAEIQGRYASDLPAFADALLRVKFDRPFAYEKVLMQMMQRMQRTGGAVLCTSKLTMKTADLAMRMQRSGVQVKLVWVSDDPRDEGMELLERLKMESVQVERVDPWKTENKRSGNDLEDDCDF
jgi:hypothetical protein